MGNIMEEMRGNCDWCGKPDCKFDYIGIHVPRFYCSEECRKELLKKWYRDKEERDRAYYSRIPHYEGEGWSY